VFCPSCGGLAFPRTGVSGNVFTRVNTIKKNKTVFENDLNEHNIIMPKWSHFKNDNDYNEANHEWLNSKPGEFEQHHLGNETEIRGKGYIKCENYRCGFHGPADDVDIELLNAMSNTKANWRGPYDVRKDSDKRQGRLTIDLYSCPKCDQMEVYSYIDHNLEFAETATTMLTCKNCDHGWRDG
jgi:DNA-directed RNA polymerase subunit M/transcription elongation factor TFIIS